MKIASIYLLQFKLISLLEENLSNKKLNKYIDNDLEFFGKKLEGTGLEPVIRNHLTDFKFHIQEFLDLDQHFFNKVTDNDFLKIIYSKYLKQSNITLFKSVDEIFEHGNEEVYFNELILGIYRKIINIEFNKDPSLGKNLPVKKNIFGWKLIGGYQQTTSKETTFFESFK